MRGQKTNKPYYNRTNTCDRCIEEERETKLYPKNAFREKNKKGDWTGKWVCASCHNKKRYKNGSTNANLMKSVRNVRTENENPNHETTKGNNSQKLVCIWKGWEDLNIKNDNHKSLIDCYDPKTGLYHQVQGRHYNSERGYWSFAGFERELFKKYKSMICICYSEDGKIVERIYEFPEKIVKDKNSATIVKDNSRGPGWYDEYRITDIDELKKVNKIWKKIMER